ncbi:hypothetical protein [Marinomonas sp. 2405UD68-3]|uniref:hypothetical protein n=1 Tax=Marinomonas sp. 2405UD68-3 TaxID=3391835 RepID=UPI0039C95A01
MDLTVLKNPVVLAILAGSVIVTNVVTYNVSAPAADYCSPIIEQALAENQAMLDELRERLAADDANLERALRPLEGLNENRGGGLSMDGSIR